MFSRLTVTTLAACVMMTAGAAVAGPAAAAGPELRLELDRSHSGTVQGHQLVNRGSAAVDARVRTRSTGTARWGWQSGRANLARLPVSSRTDGPQAVLELSPDGSDTLLPGRRSFAMSVDVRLAGATRGTAADRGNNLLQRGVWGSQGQYKLQLDGGVASCRVAGSRGAVMVKDSRAVPRGTWLRVACRADRASRDADRVALTLTVTDLRSGERRTRSSGTALVGSVAPRSAALTVGGRRPAAGGNDQLEGDVDRVVVDVL